jgi:HlyD family secretion protein
MKAFLCILAGGLTLLALAGCGQKPPASFQGYIEGEFVYVGGPLGGQLTNLAVRRGAEVGAGQLLFELEAASEAAVEREAADRLAQAGSRLEDLRKGRRPSEIASIEAQLKSAQASLELSTLEWERQKKLKEGDVISSQEWDTARTRRETDQARVLSLQADLDTARLGARADQIKAAEEEVQAAKASLAKAQWARSQKRQAAPARARVHDTLYREGEYVTAGNPVVALLPPSNIKVRFFVPQALLSSLRPGARVLVGIDGVPAPIPATVDYISSSAEFTPPVIYSKENRSKLVFMVEARFAADAAPGLKPGQPVDVSLAR